MIIALIIVINFERVSKNQARLNALDTRANRQEQGIEKILRELNRLEEKKK